MLNLTRHPYILFDNGEPVAYFSNLSCVIRTAAYLSSLRNHSYSSLEIRSPDNTWIGNEIRDEANTVLRSRNDSNRAMYA